MKIKPEHYDYIKHAIANIDSIALIAHKQRVIESGKYKKFAARIMNDCLYFAVGSQWVCDNLYPYIDDTHVQTALRRINKELKLVTEE